jgi:hypothetical protein
MVLVIVYKAGEMVGRFGGEVPPTIVMLPCGCVQNDPSAEGPRREGSWLVTVTLGLLQHSVALLERDGRVSASRKVRERVFYSHNNIAGGARKLVLTPLSQLRQASNRLVWSLTFHSYQTV